MKNIFKVNNKEIKTPEQTSLTKCKHRLTQQIFNCLKSTINTLEKDVKYGQG